MTRLLSITELKEVAIILFIDDFQRICNEENIIITKHADKRLLKRGITVDDIMNAIRTGDIIKQYEDDKPFPSCLVLGSTEYNKFIHIVVSIDKNFLYIITAYYPDEYLWETDLRNRKER